MKCPICGTEITQGATQCPSCGCKVVYNGYTSDTLSTQPSGAAAAVKEKKHLSRKQWIIIAVVLAVILVIFLIQNVSSSHSSTYTTKSADYDYDYGYVPGNADVYDWMEDQAEGKDYGYDDGGDYYCMGKNDSCPNKTHNKYDLYCDSCDPNGDNIEG